MAVVNAARSTRGSTHGHGDGTFSLVLRLASAVVVVVLIILVLTLAGRSLGVLQFSGLNYFTSSKWDSAADDPANETYGTLAFSIGTVVTSLIALALATPFAVGTALYVAEYAPRWLGQPIAFMVELLVTIPSVAYGLWGYLVLRPFMRDTVQPFLQATLGKIPGVGTLFSPFIGANPTGENWLTASVILAIMILPTILSLSREIIAQVPRLQKEGVLALGATKWEMLAKSVLPYARPGIFGAMILGLARAIGETMAVAMVVGNTSDKLSGTLFTPGYTIASFIANNFSDSSPAPHLQSALVGLGLVLLVLASLFNVLSRILVSRAVKAPGAR